jgi:PQQ-dependent dehydrogenase (methanol/ethanol family)
MTARWAQVAAVVVVLAGVVALPVRAQQGPTQPAPAQAEQGPAPPGPTQAELTAAASNAADWLLTNHDYSGQRFVAATEITRENVRRLRPVCLYQAGDLRPFHTNPIVYRGVMYLTTSLSTIALDAATCRVRWRHDWTLKGRENWPSNRGIALKDGKIIRGTRDGYLLALDAETGRVLWERAAADSIIGETFTMPPLVFEDLILIGPAGSEVPIKGWIGAFKLENGEPVWRFNTVPRPGEPGAETWGPTTAVTGGGAVWTPLSLDPAMGRVYVAAGNPAPDYHDDVREGANLYSNSLVVLDARAGTLLWHHQAVAHDTHDWDLTQASPLFSTEVRGQRRQLVAVAGKDGLVRVLDRGSREALYEVAVSRRENVDVPLTTEAVRACPGPLGGVQWNGPAFNPVTNMLYVPSVDWCATFRKAEQLRHVPGQNYMGGTSPLDPPEQGWGWLTAIDASAGTVRWRYQSRRPMLAAVTTTASGLVFTGELDGDFLVLDARDGTVLYRFNTGGAMNGGVVTYQAGGTQYVAATSGNATRFWRTPIGSATVVVFGLAPSTP